MITTRHPVQPVPDDPVERMSGVCAGCGKRVKFVIFDRQTRPNEPADPDTGTRRVAFWSHE